MDLRRPLERHLLASLGLSTAFALAGAAFFTTDLFWAGRQTAPGFVHALVLVLMPGAFVRGLAIAVQRAFLARRLRAGASRARTVGTAWAVDAALCVVVGAALVPLLTPFYFTLLPAAYALLVAPIAPLAVLATPRPPVAAPVERADGERADEETPMREAA